MKLADRIVRQLELIRDTSEKMLAAFQAPEDWTYQVAPGTNHALWFAGHMAVADNFFIGMIEPGRKISLDEFEAKFGMGSKPTSNADDYPPAAEVLDVMRERRAAVLDLLRRRSNDDLAKPMPVGTPDFWTDYGSVFEMLVWHEAMHLGQVSIVRRALGHSPLFDAVPAEASA